MAACVMAWVPLSADDVKAMEGIIIHEEEVEEEGGGVRPGVTSQSLHPRITQLDDDDDDDDDDDLPAQPGGGQYRQPFVIELQHRQPPSPPFVEVVYKTRPARHDPKEPFQPWHRNVRECVQWDEHGQRFIMSIFDGGIASVQPFGPISSLLQPEHVLVPRAPVFCMTNLGVRIDYARNRVICCVSDKFKYSLSTIVAYDYTTWKTLFLVKLQSGSPSIAHDLAVDPHGNIYVTDVYNGKIWKVNSDGSHSSVWCDNPMFHAEAPEGQPFRWVKLTGIVCHRKGFLLVAHTSTDSLFKVSMNDYHGAGKKMVKRVRGLTRKLLGDGIVLMNDCVLVMTGLSAGVHVLVSTDDWASAREFYHSPAPSASILPTSVSLKDDLPYVGYVSAFRVAPYNTIALPTFRPLRASGGMSFDDFLRQFNRLQPPPFDTGL